MLLCYEVDNSSEILIICYVSVAYREAVKEMAIL